MAKKVKGKISGGAKKETPANEKTNKNKQPS
jgi:hypothetical protein